MLTCYVIDDEQHAINSLVFYIKRTPGLELLGFSQNPVHAIQYFDEQSYYPDVTFVDINMPELSGVELSVMLNVKTAVVFTTAHPNFAAEAFDLNIKDYLLKPISYTRFLRCVSRLADELKGQKAPARSDDFFYIQTQGKGKLVKILYSDVFYIESQKNYLSIITKDQKYLTYLTLSEIEQKLPSYFIRVHKSFIVNTDKISHIEGNDIMLDGLNYSLALSLGYKDKFVRFMDEHVIKSKRFPR